tara:strand:- start:395 stop:583 length:189 start_codon:yes stop_codon:yes gene_type:complete
VKVGVGIDVRVAIEGEGAVDHVDHRTGRLKEGEDVEVVGVWLGWRHVADEDGRGALRWHACA